MSLGAPTVYKNLSLISLIPRWSGTESANCVEEFISTLEGSARIGRWEPKDTLGDCVKIRRIGLSILSRMQRTPHARRIVEYF